jgi:cytochrome c553
MGKKYLLLMVIAGLATLFVVAAINAGTAVPDVVKMENKAYEKHTKGIVEFTHKKHATDYKATCGDCHHNDKGEALKELKEGDNVQGCIECHKKPGEKAKGKDAPKLSKKEELEYHAEAVHENCKGCHKEANKKAGNKNAPETCTKCHPGKDK